MENQQKTKREYIRVGKHLNELITITDATGALIHKAIKPVMLEVYPRDIMQMIVGATLLSIPVAFTEEVWKLGETLPVRNIVLLGILSCTFIGLFSFYNSYRNRFKKHALEFTKRVLFTYIIALLVSWLILFVIDKAPGGDQWIFTLKRMIILSFPASMSAAVTDMIK